jgi:DNA repair exonuclease SbcCD ATPase subunit
LKLASSVLLLLLGSIPVLSQAPEPPATQPAGATVANDSNSIAPDLDKLQTASSAAAETIGRLNIGKWKASGEAKSAARADADSVKRNLTSAMPGMIAAVRATPDDINAEFKLYRNLSALHEVFGTVVDAMRLYGPKSDYEALAQQMQTFESARRKLGEGLERLTAETQRNLDQLRTQIKTQQDQLAASQAETADARKQLALAQAELAKKLAPKKKTVAKKPAAPANTPGPNTPATNSGVQPPTSSPPPKS